MIRHWSLPGSYRAVVKEPLDVVYQDAGHGGAVGVVEDAADLHALGRLSVACHGIWRTDLDEGKPAVHGKVSGQSCLASIGSAFEEHAD